MASRLDTAEFICKTTARLAHRARECDLELLAYILDMATMEARLSTEVRLRSCNASPLLH
jgi:hypothetical protein